VRTTWRIEWINWPVHSQQAAQKNARQALLALAQRRREREAVERFFEDREVAGVDERPRARSHSRIG